MTTKTWGKHIWYFFHILAERITEEGYINLKNEICYIISYICKHLPCVICTEHATTYIRYKLNPRLLDTKDKLKEFLFTFHNSVNERLNYKPFTDFNIYKKGNLRLSFYNFKIIYIKNYDPYRGFHETLGRKRLVQYIEELFRKYPHYFQTL